jgi:hypothetical protein
MMMTAAEQFFFPPETFFDLTGDSEREKLSSIIFNTCSLQRIFAFTIIGRQ